MRHWVYAGAGPDIGTFYRNFFGTLKAGTGEGGIERLFVTGVSPVTMDDVTSGFNIATNISLLPEFNEMLGFSTATSTCCAK